MPHQTRGFTLVEVMVALAVVALALPALLLTLQQQVDSTAYLRDKSIARLVAANKVEEYRLLLRARGQFPDEKASGTMPMTGRDWFWRSTTEKTQIPGFMRTTISVSENEDAPSLLTLTAFLSATSGTAP